MSDHPIIFNGAMVRAILDGRKTMTRRVCIPRHHDRKPCEHYTPDGEGNDVIMSRHCEHGSEGRSCPYGGPGDRLWVRETWARCVHSPDCTGRYFRADGEHNDGAKIDRWRPSIHMPRWASRLTLEVVAVRVERVRDITEDDARAEGAELVLKDGRAIRDIDGGDGWDYRLAFSELWDSINAKRGYGWAVNPFVWVVTFRRV
jgi:hypothetical protein